MKCLALSTAALLVFSAGSLPAGELKSDKLKSGLQPGDPAGAFQVLDCTGLEEGKKLCYR